jgi:hypothetical protein
VNMDKNESLDVKVEDFERERKTNIDEAFKEIKFEEKGMELMKNKAEEIDEKVRSKRNIFNEKEYPREVDDAGQLMSTVDGIGSATEVSRKGKVEMTHSMSEAADIFDISEITTDSGHLMSKAEEIGSAKEVLRKRRAKLIRWINKKINGEQSEGREREI